MIYQITKDNFEKEVLSSDKPVVLDFYATGCGPCKAQTKILENLSSLSLDSVKICKCDVDENEDFASSFGIESIPTLFFYKNGVKIGQFTGVLEKEGIKRMLEL